MHQYIAANKSENFRKIISSSCSTYNLVKEDNGTKTIVNKPTLSLTDKTFPSLYYRKKQMVTNNPKSLTKELDSSFSLNNESLVFKELLFIALLFLSLYFRNFLQSLLETKSILE